MKNGEKCFLSFSAQNIGKIGYLKGEFLNVGKKGSFWLQGLIFDKNDVGTAWNVKLAKNYI